MSGQTFSMVILKYLFVASRGLTHSLGTDACTVPVLAPPEAAEVAGSPIPNPHPSLISTPARSIEDKEIRLLGNGENTLDILRELELSQEEIESLVRSGALGKYFSKL